MNSAGVITINLNPEIHLGPLMISWMGLMTAIGIAVGALLAARGLRERRLPEEPLYTLLGLVVVGAVVGARLFYVLEHGGPVLGTHGLTFFGGVILAAVLLLAYLWRKRLSFGYLDAIAAALPLGVAIGRIGDVIMGEHYGARSNFFLAVRNTNPHALTPNPAFAYQSVSLYEALLGALIFAIVWPLRHRLSRPLDLSWLVLGLFAIGRFPLFFLRTSTPRPILGLANGQWTSVGLLILAVAGWLLTRRLQRRPLAHEHRRPSLAGAGEQAPSA